MPKRKPPAKPGLAAPISVCLSLRHLAWLDASRTRGHLSRSAAIRQALDRLIDLDVAAQSQPAD